MLGFMRYALKHPPKSNADMFFNKLSQQYTKSAQRFYNTYEAVVNGKYVDPDTIEKR